MGIGEMRDISCTKVNHIAIPRDGRGFRFRMVSSDISQYFSYALKLHVYPRF